MDKGRWDDLNESFPEFEILVCTSTGWTNEYGRCSPFIHKLNVCLKNRPKKIATSHGETDPSLFLEEALKRQLVL